MKNIDLLIKENDSFLSVLYGEDASARERIKKAVESFTSIYGEQEYSVFSVSGRSEISGNHTDHNRGEVLAASISLDIIAVAAPTDDGIIRVTSEAQEVSLYKESTDRNRILGHLILRLRFCRSNHRVPVL